MVGTVVNGNNDGSLVWPVWQQEHVSSSCCFKSLIYRWQRLWTRLLDSAMFMNAYKQVKTIPLATQKTTHGKDYAATSCLHLKYNTPTSYNRHLTLWIAGKCYVIHLLPACNAVQLLFRSPAAVPIIWISALIHWKEPAKIRKDDAILMVLNTS